MRKISTERDRNETGKTETAESAGCTVLPDRRHYRAINLFHPIRGMLCIKLFLNLNIVTEKEFTCSL